MSNVGFTANNMKSTDDIHNLTDHIYKNLVDNFNNGIRQLLLTGKAYHKALQGISSTAHAYNDALRRVGTAAKICKGGAQEIGEAILQIAEAQRDIQSQIEESTKALFTDLILPLEQKLDKEFKKSHVDHRKYTQGHKAALVPYNKAFDSLKKFRKKTKNKFVYDNEKEAQHMRTLGKCQEKLDEFRINGLRSALLEERRCHCFLLQRLCSISSRNLAGHKNGMQLYSMLPEWLESCANPHRLPMAAEQLLAHPLDEQYEPMNGGIHSNGFLHRDTRDTHSLGSPFRRSTSSHDLFRYSGHFDGTKTLPSRPAGAPPPPPSGPQVQAVYTFEATVETQLSFKEGDVLMLMGEKSEGWQYGQNASTGRYGWFPLSFTQPVSNGRISPDFRALGPGQRVKSVGDLLDSRSLVDQPFYEHDIPGNIRRPKSLYDGPPQVNSVTQNPQVTHGNALPSASSAYASPSRQQRQPPPPPPPANEDFGIEEDVNYKENPMFSSVSLRRTKTNDRSAPKIN